MKKYIVTFFLVTASLLSVQCSKQLDLVKQNAVDLDSYYANASDVDALSLSAYIYRAVCNNSGALWLDYLNNHSDDGYVYSGVNVTSANHQSSQYFTHFYNINYLSNLIIEKLADDSAVKRQVIGEAYFWRAYAYVWLIRMWGNPPLVDHVLGSSELQPANGETAALWDYVYTSLEKAVELLPEKSGLGGQRAIGGRVTKHSAYALLGKAKVIAGDYGGAVTALGKVISDGKYKLIDNFSDLYHVEADFCDEYMWEFNANDNSDVSTYVKEADRRAVQLTWDSNGITVPGGVGELGTGSLCNVHQNFYDFMVARGEKGKARYLGTVWDYEDVLDQFVSQGLAASRNDAVSKFWKSNAVTTGQGYFRAKMLPKATDLYAYPHTTTDDIRCKSNWPGMRYAEVLLLYAEACIQSGTGADQGLKALNDVRSRAGLGTLASYVLQDVKDEKRAELAFEGERLWDLIRWGDASAALAGRGHYSYQFFGYQKNTTKYDVRETEIPNAVGFEDRDKLCPYPYEEMQLNPDHLKQNPGWE